MEVLFGVRENVRPGIGPSEVETNRPEWTGDLSGKGPTKEGIHPVSEETRESRNTKGCEIWYYRTKSQTPSVTSGVRSPPVPGHLLPPPSSPPPTETRGSHVTRGLGNDPKVGENGVY